MSGVIHRALHWLVRDGSVVAFNNEDRKAYCDFHLCQYLMCCSSYRWSGDHSLKHSEEIHMNIQHLGFHARYINVGRNFHTTKEYVSYHRISVSNISDSQT